MEYNFMQNVVVGVYCVYMHAQTFLKWSVYYDALFIFFHLRYILRDPHSSSQFNCLPDWLCGDVWLPPDHSSAKRCARPSHTHQDCIRVQHEDRP